MNVRAVRTKRTATYICTCNFEKQIEIKLVHPAFTEGVTDSGVLNHSRPKSIP
ncbi:MAG: hypothetical protein P8X74_22430 [Reinekea sp.]